MLQRALLAIFVVLVLMSSGQPARAQMPSQAVPLFAYSAASNRIAIGVDVPHPTFNRNATLVEVYDAISGDYLGFIPTQEISLSYLQFNATGELLTTVTVVNDVRTWEMSTFTQTEPSLPGGAFDDGPIAWHPFDNRLAATLGRSVYISSPDSPYIADFGDEVTTSFVLAMDWSPDGNTLAISTAINDTGHITIWDVSGSASPNEPLRRIVGVPSVMLDWSPDGTALAARADGGVVIYDSTTGEVIQTLRTDQTRGRTYDIQWSPDGLKIAASVSNHLWIWDVSTVEVVAHEVMPHEVTDLSWLPNGQVLHNGSEIGLAINGSSIEGFALPSVEPTSTPAAFRKPRLTP